MYGLLGLPITQFTMHAPLTLDMALGRMRSSVHPTGDVFSKTAEEWGYSWYKSLLGVSKTWPSALH